MSGAKLKEEGERWLAQAEDDLDAARTLRVGHKLPQAGFYAQQAAEKAVKAIHHARDLDPWGHSVAKLLAALDDEPTLLALDADAAALDKLYIPTRYPDALPDIIPAEAFRPKEIDDALAAAQRIVDAVRTLLHIPS